MIYLLYDGHGCVLQISSSLLSPAQLPLSGFPVIEGGGLLHSLVRNRVPSPSQAAVQELQLLHIPQFDATSTNQHQKTQRI